MRNVSHLAVVLLLFGAAKTRAQITNPDNLVAPPPRNPAHHILSPTDDLQWLWQYTRPAPNGNEAGLLADPQFPSFLAENLHAPQTFFRNGNVSLAEVAQHYFGIVFSPVRGIDNRYITFNSCVPHDCNRHGLIWVDTAPEHPTVVFAATEWTTQGKPEIDPDAEYNLWLFSSRPIDPEHPPVNLVAAISNWNGNQPQHIETALVVDPDGTPHKTDPAALGATPAATAETK